MILLEIYVVGLVFLLGVLVGGEHPTRQEVVTVILWPVAIPLGLLIRPWHRRQIRRWNALTPLQRLVLNEARQGCKADRWPYRHTPWVPRATPIDRDRAEFEATMWGAGIKDQR